MESIFMVTYLLNGEDISQYVSQLVVKYNYKKKIKNKKKKNKKINIIIQIKYYKFK